MWGRRSAVHPGVNVLQFFLKGRKEGERHCRAQWWGVWMEWKRGKRRRRMRTTTITSPSLFLVSTRWLNNFMIAAEGKKGCAHSSSTIIMERERERESLVTSVVMGDARRIRDWLDKVIRTMWGKNKKAFYCRQAAGTTTRSGARPPSLPRALPACLPSIIVVII